MYSLSELKSILKGERGERFLSLRQWFKYGTCFSIGGNFSYAIIEELCAKIKVYNKVRNKDVCPMGKSIEEWNAIVDRLEFMAENHLDTFYEDYPSALKYELEFWKLLNDNIYNFWL